ncbi:MAG: YggW family oxidoreductase, partial [Halioglobus sp.]|nr:YggW family oxidoreductase [Halioglobus sp.]
HLSCYHLTLEPNTPFAHNPPALPDDDTAADMQEAIEARLAEAGFEHYETSAFARPHEQSRHNLNYWTFGDYLGIGAGAHGKLTADDGSCTRHTRRRQPGDYLAAMNDGGFIASKRTLSEEDLMAEFAMNALRLNAGFFITLFEQRTGLHRNRLLPVAEALAAKGLLTLSNAHIAATPLGLRFLDSVVAAFFPDA